MEAQRGRGQEAVFYGARQHASLLCMSARMRMSDRPDSREQAAQSPPDRESRLRGMCVGWRVGK